MREKERLTAQIEAEKAGKQRTDRGKNICDSTPLPQFASASSNSPYVFRERRAYPRHPCLIQGAASVPLFYEHRKWEGEGAVLNLSEGGMLFEVYRVQPLFKVRIQDPINIELVRHADEMKPIELKGVVVRQEEKERLRIGIQFKDLSDEACEVIKEILHA